MYINTQVFLPPKARPPGNLDPEGKWQHRRSTPMSEKSSILKDCCHRTPVSRSVFYDEAVPTKKRDIPINPTAATPPPA